jgi:hypothetical protein
LLDLLNAFCFEDEVVGDKDGADVLLEAILQTLLDKGPVHVFFLHFSDGLQH